MHKNIFCGLNETYYEDFKSTFLFQLNVYYSRNLAAANRSRVSSIAHCTKIAFEVNDLEYHSMSSAWRYLMGHISLPISGL